MVDLTRRKTVLGMGLLASGSGAAFTSAAFQASTTSTADMRVVVEDNLIVEAGRAFRDSSGNYESSPGTQGSSPEKNFYGTANGSLFGGLSNDGLDGLDPDEDLPAAFVNDKGNDDLWIETAVRNEDQTVTFFKILQVRNPGTEELDVGIRFPTFGDDTYGGISDNGGDVKEGKVIGMYKFKDNDTGDEISANSWESSVSDQNIDHFLTVSAGETAQIDLEIDLTDSVLRESIATAASPGESDVFNGGASDTVQLLKEIRVGSPNTSN